MRGKMKKNLFLLTLFAILTLACGLVSSPVTLPTKIPNQQAAPASNGFTRVRLHPRDGRLMNQLESEVRKAAAAGQRPFLEFDATW